MFKKLTLITLAASLLSGCASVPMENRSVSDQAKAFPTPSQGNAGIYIYRLGGLGTALKKDLWIDGRCIGETAPKVFFFEEVAGNMEHKISTESEFSPNEFTLKTESGKNYFIKQYIKMGLVVGGANLKLMDEAKGMKEISRLKMATKGKCSN